MVTYNVDDHVLTNLGLRRIARLTRTQAILEDGRRFSLADGLEVLTDWAGGGWMRPLAPETLPAHEAKLAERAAHYRRQSESLQASAAALAATACEVEAELRLVRRLLGEEGTP